jgi:hypothetical protein
VGKPERNNILGRARRRWKDNINMYVKEIRYGSVDWTPLTQEID